MTQRALLIFAFIGLLLLQGCAQNPPLADRDLSPPKAKEEPLQPFSIETLYALLVAEIAGSREHYDVALSNYTQQAHKTRDAGVAERATHVARYLNANDTILDNVSLWLELDPDNQEAHFIAATQQAQSGNIPNAFEHIEALLTSDSAQLIPALAVHAAKLNEAERQPLIEQCEVLLLSHPNQSDLMIALGLLYQQQNQSSNALGITQRALKTDPNKIPAIILEAKLLAQLERTNEAIAHLGQAVIQHPADKRLRLQYAKLLTQSDLVTAQKQFNILADQSPEDGDLIYSLALIANERGLLDDAEKHFNQLLEHEEHLSSAHYHLGKILEEKGQLKQAVKHFDQVEPSPMLLPAIVQSSDILARTNQLDTLHQRLNKQRTRFPSQAEQLFLIEADILNTHGHTSTTADILTKALNQFPASTQLLYSRAMVSEQLNKMSQLESDLRAILTYEPSNASALNALGYSLANRNLRIDEAYKLITQALAVSPDDPAILDSMGWVQYRMGNLNEALISLRKAMSSFPDHEIAAHLGEVLWVNGQQQEAVNVWQQGLELTPESSIITEVMQRLNPTPSE